jgi:enoyl-CoA hydratase
MSELTVEQEGGVGLITLRASYRRNALTATMAADLVAVCEELDRNPDIGAVVIRGEGGHFCAGAHRDTLESASSDPAAVGHY